jgi:RNA-directed DNA polymerase
MGGTSGHARREQSGLGAAIISGMYDPHERLALARELADAFLGGVWRAEDLAERGASSLDRWPEWMDGLAFAAVALSRVAPLDRRDELVGLIEAYLRRHSADPRHPGPPQILRHLRPHPPGPGGARTSRSPAVHPKPRGPAHDWRVARIDSVGSLAERLELSTGQLAWLADARGLERTAGQEKLRNYRYRWVRRRTGLPRLIEAPKARLKEVQRWVLHEILDHVPAHAAAHGFTPGRSVHTHATLHIGRRVVLRLDLRDFFAAIPAGRVYGMFRTLGYTHDVAHTLTALCTNSIPAWVWEATDRPLHPRLIQPHFWLGRQLATPHLPQGAPTSPALANLAAFRLDRRLTGLSTAFHLRYSRYADDLTFSGPRLAGRANRALIGLVAQIAAEEGFRVHPDKSSLRTDAQRQVVTGIVVNRKLNIARDDYDRLKARLHRLAVDGPDSPRSADGVDPQAHLRGQVAWVASLNSGRGEKLRRLLDAVDWDQRPG